MTSYEIQDVRLECSNVQNATEWPVASKACPEGHGVAVLAVRDLVVLELVVPVGFTQLLKLKEVVQENLDASA